VNPHASKSAIHHLVFGLAIATIVPFRVTAQQLEPRTFPQVGVRSYSFRSAVMARQYDISVGFPVGYDANPDATYPALIVTDGNRMFPGAYGMASGLMSPAASAGDIEPLFIVSIGTPFELGESAWTQRRVHEFSPPDWPLTDAFGKLLMQGVCQRQQPPLPRETCTGGAPRFLEFIVSELLPALTAAHRIDPERLGLFGVSAGGFFAAWTIFQERSPFTTYLISSPAMAYGDGDIYRQEARYAAAHADLPVSIYLASGGLEIDDPFIEGMGQIVSGQARLGALLRGRSYASLVLHSEIHHGLGHSDAAAMTMARGLRLLYPRPTAAR
jgi:predicted alpha/beta superfamily hydrolase